MGEVDENGKIISDFGASKREKRDPIRFTEATVSSNGDLNVYFSEKLHDLDRLILGGVTLKILNEFRYKVLEINYTTYVEEDESLSDDL